MGFFNSTSNEVPLSTLRANLNLSANAVDTAPRMNSQNATMASGQCYFTFFTPSTNLTVSNITVATAGTAATSLTYAALGLYTFDGTTATLVARTASDTSLYGSTFTNYTRSFDTTGGFPASYTLVAGQRYGLGLLVVTAGTAPAIYLSSGFIPNNLSTLDPRMTALKTGETSLPLTVNSFTTTTAAPWGRLS